MPDEASRQAGGAVGTPAGSGGGSTVTAFEATPAAAVTPATDRDREGEEGRALAVLAARVQAGDRAAEAELVERFSRGLRLMLRRLAQNPALADDLFQETLALVLEKLRRGEVREPERLAGFIRSTARNLFIADRRKEARYTPLEAPGDLAGGESGGGGGGGGALGDLPVRGAVGGAGAVGIASLGGGAAATASGGGAPAALATAMAKQEAEQVRRLLGEMRYERDRQVLVRFYLLDDDRESVCAHLGIEPERFNQVLHRARERLRELWERAEKRQRFFSAVRGIVGRVGEDPSPGK